MQKKENDYFYCKHCGKKVLPLTNGSYRNHCPFCLYSFHVDNQPGDRKCPCYGLMAPTTYRYHSKKGYQILHVCKKCGKKQWNKIAENTEQPDHFIDWIKSQSPNHFL